MFSGAYLDILKIFFFLEWNASRWNFIRFLHIYYTKFSCTNKLFGCPMRPTMKIFFVFFMCFNLNNLRVIFPIEILLLVPLCYLRENFTASENLEWFLQNVVNSNRTYSTVQEIPNDWLIFTGFGVFVLTFACLIKLVKLHKSLSVPWLMLSEIK